MVTVEGGAGGVTTGSSSRGYGRLGVSFGKTAKIEEVHAKMSHDDEMISGGRSGSSVSEEDDEDSLGEIQLVESKVRDMEQTLSVSVDTSIWEGQGPTRIRKWTTSNAFFSQPLLVDQVHLTPLVNLWYKDVVVIPHNAIRMELIDLYKIIRSFEMFQQKVNSSDLARFFTWFDLMENFVTTFLDLEEDLIMKPVDSVAKLPSVLNPVHRIEEKVALTESFRIINTYRVKAEVLKEDEVQFKELIRACRILSSRLVNYLSLKEKYVPDQIKKYSNESETEAMQSTMVMRIKTQPRDGDKMYVLYMRDLDVKTAGSWNRRYLRWMQRHILFRKWRRQLRTHHYNLVDQVWRDVGDPGNTYLPGTWGSPEFVRRPAPRIKP